MKRVEPFTVSDAVRPAGELVLSREPIELFDSVAVEHTDILGTEVDLWQRDVSPTTIDPLYGEVDEVVWKGPYGIRCWVQWAQVPVEQREGGFRKVFPSELWVCRKTLELAGSLPLTVGDIVRFWDLPYFEDVSNTYDVGTEQGYFFNVMLVSDDGHLFDTSSFVGFRGTLARNTEFTPERRL